MDQPGKVVGGKRKSKGRPEPVNIRAIGGRHKEPAPKPTLRRGAQGGRRKKSVSDVRATPPLTTKRGLHGQ